MMEWGLKSQIDHLSIDPQYDSHLLIIALFFNNSKYDSVLLKDRFGMNIELEAFEYICIENMLHKGAC